jgi:two-component system, LytTR family, response regulator
MIMISTLIIDDEAHARKRITDLLGGHENFRIVQECKNGQEALAAIKKLRPDVIFLDIQMPGFTGIDVARMADYEPIIVFVTAFEMHALEAFELNALDYLLKPFSNDRFLQTIARIEEAIDLKDSNHFKFRVAEMMKESKRQPFLKVISVKAKGTWFDINLLDVGYIKTEGNYVRIYTKDRFYLHRVTIQELQEFLDPKYFMRIHRGVIINCQWIKSVKYLVQNFEYRFSLIDNTALVSGRSYKSTIDSFLEKNPELAFHSN